MMNKTESNVAKYGSTKDFLKKATLDELKSELSILSKYLENYLTHPNSLPYCKPGFIERRCTQSIKSIRDRIKEKENERNS